MEKVCSKCKEVRPLEQFRKTKKVKSGFHAACKQCDRSYRQDNSEKIKIHKQNYYLENRERISESRKSNPRIKQYNYDKYWSDPETARRRVKEYLASNPQAKIRKLETLRSWYKLKGKETAALWRQRNPDKSRIAARTYYRRHTELVRNVARIARAKRTAAFVVHISAADLRDRASVFGNKCAYCSGPHEHWDHLKPISLGGKHILSNLRPACAKCNLTKSNKHPNEWLKRL